LATNSDPDTRARPDQSDRDARDRGGYSHIVGWLNAGQFISATGPVFVAGAVAAVGYLFKNWQAERDQAYRHKETFERASREVEFMESWRQVATNYFSEAELAAFVQESRQKLLRLHEVLLEDLDALPQVRRQTLGGWLRLVLLIGPLDSWVRKAARILYWVWSALLLLLWLPSIVTVKEQRSWYANVALSLFVFAVLAAPSLLLWVPVRRRIRSITAGRANAAPAPG
jgi:hypothetical protein